MLVSCSNSDFKDSDNFMNSFYEIEVKIYEDELLSLCDVFNRININMPVKFIYNHNPFLIVKFSGNMRDFIYYLDNVLKIHCEFEIVDNSLVVLFTECSISKEYSIQRMDCKFDQLIPRISVYAQDVFRIDNNLSVRSTCHNHKIIENIIKQYDSNSNLSMKIEFVVLEIYNFDSTNYNFLNILDGAFSMFDNDWNRESISSLINSISSFLDNNKSGYCKVNSSSTFVLHNGSSVEITNGVNKSNTEYYVNNKGKILNHMSVTDKGRSHLKLKVSGLCDDNRGEIKFELDSKSNISNTDSGVSTLNITRKFINNETLILSQRNITRENESSSLFSERKEYEVTIVIMVNIQIIGEKK